ncbi:MAG: hypothetical protein NC355_09795 [Blautia sp.]|nr:hypothetical protein [Blautia sp.]
MVLYMFFENGVFYNASGWYIDSVDLVTILLIVAAGTGFAHLVLGRPAAVFAKKIILPVGGIMAILELMNYFINCNEDGSSSFLPLIFCLLPLVYALTGYILLCFFEK